MKHTREGYRNVERVMKGVANHYRAEILSLLKNKPELSLSQISDSSKSDFRTISEHVKKMVHAGLVMKRSDGVSVRHKLTRLGEHVVQFLSTIANE
jgi:DNA-binding transcriptional ArsR family regulator